jgi:hypothetical protein
VIAMNDETGAPGRWTRYARWLGLDHNPMRRRGDRLEVVLRLTTVLLILMAVPLAVIGVGRTVDHLVIRQAQAERATDRQVSAVLTQAAPAQGTSDLYSDVQTAWVPARWTAPNGTVHTGSLLAVAGARKGSTVRTWVTPSGVVTTPPTTHADTVGDVFIASAATAVILPLVLAGLCGLGRQLLDRRRMNAWDAEWQAVEPLWTRHRSG